MSEPGPARDRQRRRPRVISARFWLVHAHLLLWLTGPGALAQESLNGNSNPNLNANGNGELETSVLLMSGRSNGASSDGAALRRLLPPALAALPGDVETLGRHGATVARARLAGLAGVDALLTTARQQMAALDEAGALSSLARAADQVAQLGDVPGASGYAAEVQLLLGVNASQAGMEALATIALRRAATLDPARRLAAGEAPPDVVQHAARLAREVATGPVGELVVRTDTPGARVFVDDVDRGPAPASLRLPVGLHVLRVQAPGHVPYGAMLDVLQGQRPGVPVVLTPDPAMRAAQALARAADAADYGGVVSALAQLQAADVAASTYVLEAGANDRRALLIRCRAAGCQAPSRLEGTRKPGQVWMAPPGPLSELALMRARRWLADSSGTRTGVGRAKDGASGTSGYLWVAAGAATVAVIAAGAVLLAPEPEARLRVVVDPGDIRQ